MDNQRLTCTMSPREGYDPPEPPLAARFEWALCDAREGAARFGRVEYVFWLYTLTLPREWWKPAEIGCDFTTRGEIEAQTPLVAVLPDGGVIVFAPGVEMAREAGLL